MFEEIKLALSSANALSSLAKTALAARDQALIRDALEDMQMKLSNVMAASLSTVEKSAALQSQLSALERENADLKSKLDEKGRYRLQEIKQGTFVYSYQQTGEGPDAPQHYLCQNCYDKGIKSILRYYSGGEWEPAQWGCAEQSRHTICL